MNKKKMQIKSLLSIKNIITIALAGTVLVLAVLLFNSKGNEPVTDHKAIKLKFENIGELATQVSYATEVGSIKDAREVFGLEVPFTQSSYIYSYDFVIKVGFDFCAIDWKEKGNVVKVRMPAPKILSNEIKLDTLKIYNEEESIFTNIDPKTVNDNTSAMKEEAQNTAIENGIYDLAKKNAEIIIKAFLSGSYSFDEKGGDSKVQHTIEFEYPKEAENEGKN